MTDEEIIAAAGEPVAWRFTAPGITKLDNWPHGGKWHSLYPVSSILSAAKPLLERIAELEESCRDYAAQADTDAEIIKKDGAEIHYLRSQLSAAQEDNKRLRDALKKIYSIQDHLDGGDWDEIDEARNIANTALSNPPNE